MNKEINMFDQLKSVINHAQKVSMLSSFRFKLGAVVFQGKRIISTGFNKNKTHPKLERYFQHARIHAEADAILHATTSVKKASMFVCRFDKNNMPRMAKPCPMCVQVMYEFGIKDVFWTISQFPYWNYSSVEELYDKIDREMAYKNNKFK